jgi:hypothetical protein
MMKMRMGNIDDMRDMNDEDGDNPVDFEDVKGPI